ncbi:MAG TPA: pilus assembly PilX N-terminal domain-containing protein [Terriglobia bacterium]|nr:pilus assembly PilX N-terminal domain-containing protein [Terriglobia bacterium]
MDSINDRFRKLCGPLGRSLARWHAKPCWSAKRRDRGVALVLTLLLMAFMSLLGFLMMISASSDLMMNGYYRNYRGSFYSADSGLNIARQQLVNQITSQVPATFSAPPLTNPAGSASTAVSYINTNYGSFTSLNGGQAAQSWAGSFKITNASFLLVGSPTVTQYCTPGPSCSAVPNGYANSTLCTAANAYIADVTACSYTYQYSVTSVGAAWGSEQATLSENGSVIVNIAGVAATTTTNFASYGCFLDQWPPCTLGWLVPGYMTGPMFTNGSWGFGTGGSYIFTDPVGQANPNASYWFGGNCIQSPTSSLMSGNQLIKPTFEGAPPFTLGMNPAPLPANSFSQQWAAVDAIGAGESTASPTAAQMNAVLKTASGTAYPTSGNANGVYMAYGPDANGEPDLSWTDSNGNPHYGGGIYVEGSATIGLSTSGTSAQVMTITQGSTTTTITVDPLATPPTSWNCPSGTVGTTTLQTGSTTKNICSVPTNHSVTPSQPGTMLYVDGTINGLSGPGQGVAAIQDYNALTIVANGQINITGDVVYKTEPVTTTQNQIVPGTNPPCCNGSPADTLIPGHDTGQNLGIFTSNGNINLSSPYANSNLQVDGSQATLQQGSQYCFTVSGFIDTFNNVGGQIQSGICAADMNTENTYFDRRYTAKQGFAPPWFPSTTITATGPSQATPTVTVQRVQWVNTTALQ